MHSASERCIGIGVARQAVIGKYGHNGAAEADVQCVTRRRKLWVKSFFTVIIAGENN
jgi:hypothetical protein